MLTAQSAQSIPERQSFSVCNFSVLLCVDAILCSLTFKGHSLTHPFTTLLPAVAHVPQAHRQQGINVVVVQRVVDDLPLAPSLRQAQAAEHTQVLRHRGL